MAQAIRQMGHKSGIVGRPGPFVDKARSLEISAWDHAFGFDFNPASIAFFLNLFKKQRPDAVVCNISKDLRTAGVAARLAGIPIIQHLGSPGDVKNNFKTRLTQRLLRPCLLACSDYVRQRLLQSVPLYQSCIFDYIFPGTRINPVPPETVRTPKVIIATSQLNQDKRHMDLLEALAALNKNGYEFRCIIVGTGKDEYNLKQACHRLGLDELVEWTGFVTDVRAQLQRADIFVLPTGCEPLGIALEEAMANGLVPIARNIGGPTEIWHPQWTNLLIEPLSNEIGFQQAIAGLLDMADVDLLALKRDFHTHAGKTFSQEGQAKRLLTWLEQCI
ncbi:glycosyltransferase [Pseudodesulfovibrio sp. S3-i]|nr:glycosyltransferase [Pseudodesulfovibrio sp. S3-i]